MLYLGLDIGKRTHVASLMDSEGKILFKGFSFQNSTEGAESLLQRLASFCPSTDECLIAMEATGHYWLALYAFLDQKDYIVHVINPIQTDGWRKGTEIRKRKNDTIDSVLIADLIRYGSFHSHPKIDENYFALRQLCRYRTYLVGTASDFKRKIIALLDQVFPEYEALFSSTGIFGKASQTILSTFTVPEELNKISAETLTQVIQEASRKRLGKHKVEALKQAAAQSFGIRFAQDAFIFQLRSMLDQLAYIEFQIKQTEEEINHHMQLIDSMITTIPGIGIVIGATILGEIGDIQRFSNPKKLVAYAGIDASVTQSGEYEATHNVMSKRGSPYLRKALFQAALVASRCDPTFRAFYDKKRAEGKHHFTAIGAVARKLCYVIHAILTKNEPCIIQQS
ncbi:IS110 family transposase [Enterococcus columbae]|uniref:Transposase n=1 Tax=Enterococcus columbae DSM 7374 = ATCC 51263 TaxID=1121865 RepID=S0KGE4_9ENTE|nr:IS110 family transposase [Enterococcus columbae]EOT43859.1 transposase [Enterococcus columbae DSM 7374 = ATCC 51263]EOW87402.1 transposase [Enterococcus columbae DSM 7374 = ATCC 51263]OJG22408.1 transposase [Enterococcus columbae DSM 7374 = ATCC 51263]